MSGLLFAALVGRPQANSIAIGFQHAGVTKGIMIILALSSLSASLLDIKPYLHLQLVPHITKYRQLWRILIHPLAFANSTELLMGEILFYNVGVGVERAFGSRKYASFILVSTLLSTFLACISILVGYQFGLNSIPAGPYGIIFSLLWQQYRIFPSLYHFRVLGIDFSSKVFNWILASQLISSNPPSSILISLLGLLTGYIYRTDTLIPLPSLSISRRRLLVRRPLKTYRIPLSLHQLLSRLFSPIVGSSLPPRRSQRVLPGQSDSRGISTALPSSVGMNQQPGVGRGATTANDTGTGIRPSLRSLLASRLNTSTNSTNTNANQTQNGSNDRTNGSGSAQREGREEPRSATAAMGEWVNDMTGRSTRVATEDEIATLSNMFPNLGREVIVRALQTNDFNTAQAVEALLQESG
ncbi:uncharacterized protein IL334_003954 [Kwoniella shivajii]|uniref:CUE domain-containing protein n=1 Tax=Kwoniella shivajii TaxID=564305 RepID=A0ABZ1CZK8_9TREE|nr:hypothetical protein IL334_003954 [Kwoniella shivajii]